jgi:hypothetical protein
MNPHLWKKASMRKTVVYITMQYILNQVSRKSGSPVQSTNGIRIDETLDVSRNTFAKL